jgi:hypothetical protein
MTDAKIVPTLFRPTTKKEAQLAAGKKRTTAMTTDFRNRSRRKAILDGDPLRAFPQRNRAAGEMPKLHAADPGILRVFHDNAEP